MSISFGKQFFERNILHIDVLIDGELSSLVLEKSPHSCRKWEFCWEGELLVKLKDMDHKCACRQLVFPNDGGLREMKQRVISWVEKKLSEGCPLYDENGPFRIYPCCLDNINKYYFKNFFLDTSGKILELKEETENEAI